MHIIIAYDISDNVIRGKIFSYLKEKGINSQKSVFECEMDLDVFNETYRFAQSLQFGTKDSIIFYPLCKRCSNNVYVLGQGVKLIKTDWMII